MTKTPKTKTLRLSHKMRIVDIHPRAKWLLEGAGVHHFHDELDDDMPDLSTEEQRAINQSRSNDPTKEGK